MRPSLTFDLIDSLDEDRSDIRRWVPNYHDPNTIAFTPQNILPIRYVGPYRFEQGAIECVLRDAQLLHARLGMAADRNVP